MPKWCLSLGRLCGAAHTTTSARQGSRAAAWFLYARSLQTTHDNLQRDDNPRYDESCLPALREKERPQEGRERELCFLCLNVMQQLILTAAVKLSKTDSMLQYSALWQIWITIMLYMVKHVCLKLSGLRPKIKYKVKVDHVLDRFQQIDNYFYYFHIFSAYMTFIITE